MLAFIGTLKELLVAIVVFAVGIIFVIAFVRPTATNLGEVMEGEYRYKFDVELPEGYLKLICQSGRVTTSTPMNIVLRFDPSSYSELKREVYPETTDNMLTGARIEIDLMVDAYDTLKPKCVENEAENTYTCTFLAEGVTAPKKYCRGSGVDAVPVYVSLWDVDKCELWSRKDSSLIEVANVCLEPGALKGISKTSEKLEVRW